jgi:hypothetical protein
MNSQYKINPLKKSNYLDIYEKMGIKRNMHINTSAAANAPPLSDRTLIKETESVFGIYLFFIVYRFIHFYKLK